MRRDAAIAQGRAPGRKSHDRSGARRGDNGFTNGDMEAGTAGWTTSPETTPSSQTTPVLCSGKFIRATVASGTFSQISQDVLTSGKTYRLTVCARRNAGSGTPRAKEAGGNTVWQGAATDGAQLADETFVASVTGFLRLQCTGLAIAAYCDWDDAYISEE